MTYDPVDHQVLVFGPSSETWTYSNGTWTQLHPQISPSPRSEATFAWDEADGYALLYGGSGCINPPTCTFNGALNDTWKFSGGVWTRLATAVNPGPREQAAMTYDGRDSYILLMGGYQCSGTCGTWKFVAGAWSQVAVSGSVPPDSYDSSLAYDQGDGYAVLFGGVTSNGVYSGSSWLYHAGNWAAGPVGPSLREGMAVAWDPTLGGIVGFGGFYFIINPITYQVTFYVYSDTWEFSSGAWSHVALPRSPPQRWEAGLAFDGISGNVVLISGCSPVGCPGTDTWVFGPAFAVGVEATPTGCGAVELGDQGLLSGAVVELPVGPYAVSTTPCLDDQTLSVSAQGNVSFNATNQQLRVAGAGEIQVSFGPLPHTVRFFVDPPGCGSVTLNASSHGNGTTGNFTRGNYSISATGCLGFVFVNWTLLGPATVGDPNASRTALHLMGNISLEAYLRFSPQARSLIPYYIEGTVGAIAAVMVAVVYFRRRRPAQVATPTPASQAPETPSTDGKPQESR